MRTMHPNDVATYIATYKKDIRYISGKWFYKNVEVKDFKRYLFNVLKNEKIYTKRPNDIKEIMEAFIMIYGEDGQWPPLPIIEEAQKYIDEVFSKGIDLPEMPYILSENQLKIIKYLLTSNLSHFIIIYGTGGSGKSTFLNIIKQIFDNDFESVALDDLTTGGFYLANALKSRINVNDDISDKDIDSATLKQIVTGNSVEVEEKCVQPYKVLPQTKFIFSCNEMTPVLPIYDSGILRRTLGYKMDSVIQNVIPGLDSKKWNKEEILSFTINAMAQNIDNIVEDLKEDTHELLLKRNTVYLNQADYYGIFVDMVRGSGRKPCSQEKWERQVEIIKKWGKWHNGA